MVFNADKYIGKEYNGIILLEFSHFKEYKRSRTPFFKCQCHCGKEFIVSQWCLANGGTKSCGCFRINQSIKLKAGLKHLYTSYKSGAIKRGYDFELTIIQFEHLTQQNCYYCNNPPSGITKGWSGYSVYIYNGIDRTDNTIGYIYNNCVPCCKICNRAKSDLTYEEFIQWIERIKTFDK